MRQHSASMRRGLVLALTSLCLALPARLQAFPLHLQGGTVEITAATTRAQVAAAVTPLLPSESLGLDTPERLQYDYSASPDTAPLTLIFDFAPHQSPGASGPLQGIILDAMAPEQNPPARELAAWLAAHAGPGRKDGTSTVWTHDGFVFRLEVAADAGEDSIYGFWIDRP